MNNPIITFMGAVHPNQCDAMMHMNTRYYAAMFDDASFQFLGRVSGDAVSRNVGWADVFAETTYLKEVKAGALITISTRLTKIGSKSISYRHSMYTSNSDILHSTSDITVARFDIIARKACQIEGAILERAKTLLEQ